MKKLPHASTHLDQLAQAEIGYTNSYRVIVRQTYDQMSDQDRQAWQRAASSNLGMRRAKGQLYEAYWSWLHQAYPSLWELHFPR